MLQIRIPTNFYWNETFNLLRATEAKMLWRSCHQSDIMYFYYYYNLVANVIDNIVRKESCSFCCKDFWLDFVFTSAQPCRQHFKQDLMIAYWKYVRRLFVSMLPILLRIVYLFLAPYNISCQISVIFISLLMLYEIHNSDPVVHKVYRFSSLPFCLMKLFLTNMR